MSKRRPRFKRTNPLPARITKDDIAITRYVAQHRFRRSSDIFRHLSHRPPKKLRERLRKLYDLGFLDRPLAQRDDHIQHGKTHLIYALGDRGAQLLSEVDGFVAPKSNWTHKNRSVRRQHIHHTLRVADICDAVYRLPQHEPSTSILSDADILRHAPNATRHDSKPWRWPARIRLPDNTLRPSITVPDFVFGIDFADQRKRYFYFCEADRGTMPVYRSNHKNSSVVRKFETYLAGYHAGLHTSRYGIGNLRFLIVTTSQQRINTMIKVLTNVAGSADTSMFFFADIHQLLEAKHILDVPWRSTSTSPTPLVT
ncbi:MAG: replication-relaxation family protein [Hyphomicrobiaceae bacterium]